MRYLIFEVTNQKVVSTSDNSNIVMGTKGYLYVRVNFIGNDWNGCKVVARFSSGTYEEYVPIIDNICKVPEEAASKRSFKISFIGRKKDYQISTGQIVISQKE